jgi:hypothetical protein
VSHDGGESWEWAGSLYAAYNSDRHLPGYFTGCPDLVTTADGNLAAVFHSYQDDDGEMCLHLMRLKDVS